jgi:hypothetical protein
MVESDLLADATSRVPSLPMMQSHGNVAELQQLTETRERSSLTGNNLTQ